MPPVCLLLGEEILLREEFLSRLLSALLLPGMEALNLEILPAAEAEGADLVARCRIIPAFSTRRVVLLKEVDRLHAEAWEAILAYLEAPSTTTCLVLVADKLEQRSKALQRIDRVGEVLRFTRPVEGEVRRWIRERARHHGKSLSSEAEILLLNLQGLDLLRLAQEVDKLCLFVGDRQRIELEAVEALVGEGRVRGIFELTGAVSRRDLVGALVCLRRLLEGGEDSLQILGMLARQVRLLLRAKELLAEPRPPAEISRMLGIPPRFLPEILEGAEATPLTRLEQGIVRLLALDGELKSRGKGQSLYLELAIIDLCS
ncbi:MAG: DNA polymerase III subunit delta [Candidatus Methylomirabilales bacterium]